MKLTKHQESVLVGTVLGDASITRRGESSNCSLTQSFSGKFAPYSLLIRDTFLGFLPPRGYYSYVVYSVPMSLVTPETKSYIKHTVRTRALSVFTPYHNLFYTINPNWSGSGGGRYIKIIPADIALFLTALALAHLIMSDGSFNKIGGTITISVNDFTKVEVDLLATAIKDNSGIDCWSQRVRTDKEWFSIYIPKSSLPVVQAVVKDYFIPSMLYKIGL